MHCRLNLLLMVACVLILAGCGGGVGNVDSLTGNAASITGLETEQAQARLSSSIPVPRSVSSLIERGIEARQGLLPEFNSFESLGRLVSGVVPHLRNGADTFAEGGMVTSYGNSLSMISPSGPSFGIYEISGIGQSHLLTKLTVTTSSGSFKGDDPGYWIGISNYATGRWDTLGLSQDSEYMRSFGGTADYTSLGGSIFVFILIMDSQEIIIDTVTLEIDDSVWMEVEVDDGPDSGWTPAIEFLLNGNPIVVYSDYGTTNSMGAVGDRSAGLSDPANWATGTIGTPPGTDTYEWMDIVIDPAGNPIVSMVLTTDNTGKDNSKLTYSVFADTGTNWVWSTREYPGFLDGLEYTSIARHPITGVYYIATCAYNLNDPARTDHDLYYASLSIGDPDDIHDDGAIEITRQFDDYFNADPVHYKFRYPHLRFNPATGKAAVCADGGILISEKPSEPGWYVPYSEFDSDLLGSIAFNPVDNELGQSFAYNSAGGGTLDFVDYNAGMVGFRGTIETIAAADKIGEASQLAYAPDGTAGVAYTRADGASMDIIYAWWDGSWVIEQVNHDPLFPGAGEQVIVDLAYDASGVAAVCWNHIAGGGSTLHVAMRGV